MVTRTVEPDELGAEILKDLYALNRAITDEAQSRIIDRMPKDTGSAAASVTIGVGVEDTTYEKDDTDFNGKKGKNSNTIKSSKDEELLVITINAPYGAELENGTSSKAPQGMIQITGEETSQIVRHVEDKIDSYR